MASRSATEYCPEAFARAPCTPAARTVWIPKPFDGWSSGPCFSSTRPHAPHSHTLFGHESSASFTGRYFISHGYVSCGWRLRALVGRRRRRAGGVGVGVGRTFFGCDAASVDLLMPLPGPCAATTVSAASMTRVERIMERYRSCERVRKHRVALAQCAEGDLVVMLLYLQLLFCNFDQSIVRIAQSCLSPCFRRCQSTLDAGGE